MQKECIRTFVESFYLEIAMHGNWEGLTLKVRTQTGGSSKKCRIPLISLLYWKCNRSNGNSELAICDKGMDVETCNCHLQALFCPVLKEFLKLRGSPSSSSRILGSQNQLQTCRISNFEMLLLCHG